MDDDIYAYEQEMDEMDEWEAMHAHEMEAADDEMCAMEAAAKSKSAAVSSVSTSTPATVQNNVDADGDVRMSQQREADNAIDTKIARAQDRLNKVLERCATLMGEDDDVGDGEADEPETELIDDNIVRKQKATTLDSTTASFLLSRPPIDVDSLPVVINGSQRMFLRKKAVAQEESVTRTASNVVSTLSLVPIQEMMDNIERVSVAFINSVCRIRLANARRVLVCSVKSRQRWRKKENPHWQICLCCATRRSRRPMCCGSTSTSPSASSTC